MKRKRSKILIALVAITFLITIGAVATGHIPGHMNHSMSRHIQGMMGDVPAPYAGMNNPLPDTPEVIAEGAELFTANCSACHGPEGRGDGPAGENLSPTPSDLTHIMEASLARDDYLFWAMSEGGNDFGTDMPAFNEVLGEEERWQIIRFLRTLEP